jgi:succinate dehydrogenase flavin-adding protein (antitoxin of CptAB toxin-antitoxin module)
MKELDLLLERFLTTAYATVSPEEKRLFASFLELPDPQLAAYLLGHEVPREPGVAALARCIASCRD